MIFGTPPIVTNGLVLHLDAGSRQSYVSGSTTWTDLSGNNNSGSLTNGPTFSTDNQGNIVFDGTNDYVNFGLILPFADNPFSLAAWVRTTYNGSNPQTIMGRESMTDPYPGYQLGFNTVTATVGDIGKIGFNMIASPGIQPIRRLTVGTYNNGAWIYVVATYNGSKSVSGMIIYVNGVSVPTTTSDSTITGTLTNSTNFEIGARDGIQQPFTGNIALSSVYNRAISAQEVTQNYNATKNRFGLT